MSTENLIYFIRAVTLSQRHQPTLDLTPESADLAMSEALREILEVLLDEEPESSRLVLGSLEIGSA